MSAAKVTTGFANALKKWRCKLGLTQMALAQRSGLHRTYIAGIESGARNVTLRNVNRLASALEVSVARLLWEGEAEISTDRRDGLLSSGVDILLVEDNQEDVELTMRAFEVAHLSNPVFVASDGAEALEFLFAAGRYAARRAAGPPELILLDLNLPKISGLEVLQRLKSDLRTQSIPVVVLTASRESGDVLVSRRLGAADYIVKPVGFENLAQATARMSFRWTLSGQKRAQPAVEISPLQADSDTASRELMKVSSSGEPGDLEA